MIFCYSHKRLPRRPEYGAPRNDNKVFPLLYSLSLNSAQGSGSRQSGKPPILNTGIKKINFP